MIKNHNHLLELQLFQKDVIQNLHWDLETIDKQSYEELMEVMSANADNKMLSAEDLMSQWQSLS
ncbi:hypothetical protein GYN24_04325 [Lactococcus piscium]|uniref:hypothetical protein n=1 Tax=Pseudolactococcus paracarnosus TaxID=2749962 RepID=UPI001FBA3B5E|nr:hypothetical protein [Lactococcus paracarnosus]MCJ1993804.1 hypothetical protein [Lactococcus paracarnosus]